MTWLSNANIVLMPVVALLLGAPKYLQGNLTLGELMQIAAAFAQVHLSLNWLANNAVRIAEWLASARRVVELSASCDELDAAIEAAAQEALSSVIARMMRFTSKGSRSKSRTAT